MIRPGRDFCRRLSADIQSGYNAYPYEIQESAWSDWKSEKTDGFTAAIVGQAPAAPFIATYQSTLADSLEAAGVEIVLNVAPNDPSDVPGQLQQFGQALSLKPDIIFFNATAPEAALDLVSQAHDAGIPVISMVSQIDSPYSISVTYNATFKQWSGAAETVKNIGGKGSLLEVTGIPGISNEIAWEDGNREGAGTLPGRDGCGTGAGHVPATGGAAGRRAVPRDQPGRRRCRSAGGHDGLGDPRRLRAVGPSGAADLPTSALPRASRRGPLRTPTTPTSARLRRLSRWRSPPHRSVLKSWPVPVPR